MTTSSSGYEYTFAGMGSVLSCNIYDIPENDADEIAGKLLDWCEVFEARYSRFRSGSLVHKLNNGERVEITPQEVVFFTEMQQIINQTKGHFYPFVQLESIGYTSHSDHVLEKIPTASLIYHNGLEFTQTHAWLTQGSYLDLGAIGKGYAVDRAILYLQSLGVSRAICNFGGDIGVFGFTDDHPARIGTRSPTDAEKVLRLDLLTVGAIATSGTYLRKWHYQDALYNHIVRMQPQEDADQFISVTVLHDSCAWADALATAIISMGQSKAKIWNTQYNYTYHGV